MARPHAIGRLVAVLIACFWAWCLIPSAWAEDADEVIGTPATLEESAVAMLADSADATDETVVLSVVGSYDPDAARELLALVNEARASAGRDALVWDDGLETMALLRVVEASLYFDHNRPNGGYCFSAAGDVGISLHTAGENIAGGQKTAEAANKSFTESSGHYANMVKASYKSFGAACFVGVDGQVFWCEIFDSASGSAVYDQVPSGSVEIPIEIEASRLDQLSLEADYSNPTFDGTTVGVRHKNFTWNRAFATFAADEFGWSVSGVAGMTISARGTLSNPCLLGGTFTVTAASLSYGYLAASVSLNADSAFSDTPEAWYMTGGYVPYVYRNGLMTGYSGTMLFGPDDPITRGQVATILYRMATGDVGSGGVGGTFVDVPSGMYYTTAVEWCYSHGIVTGDRGADGSSLGTFRPDDLVTREEFATMLHRFALACGVGGGSAGISGFPDAGNVSSFAVEHIGWCTSVGILTGNAAYSPARLLPQGMATRAEAAKMITVLHRDVLGGYVPGVAVLAAQIEQAPEVAEDPETLADPAGESGTEEIAGEEVPTIEPSEPDSPADSGDADTSEPDDPAGEEAPDGEVPEAPIPSEAEALDQNDPVDQNPEIDVPSPGDSTVDAIPVDQEGPLDLTMPGNEEDVESSPEDD